MTILPRRLLAFALVSLALGSALLRAASLETDRFSITLREDGSLVVADKSARATWSQPALPVKAAEAAVSGGSLTFKLNGELMVRVTPGDGFIDLQIDGAPETGVEGLEYPAGFTLAKSTTEQHLLLPFCAGLSIPFNMKGRADLERIAGYYETGIDQGGLMMPWTATTDGRAGSMMLVRTPYDSRVKVWTDGEGYQYATCWKNTKGRLGYARQVRYHFTADGGAVALSKIYRKVAQEEGLLVTLREKSKNTPAISNFLGAISLWIVDWPDIGWIRNMKAAGVERALVSYHVTGQVPAGVVNRFGHNTVYEAVDRAFAAELHSLGYLAGRYDYYRTIYPPNDTGRGGNGWVMRAIGYPEQLALDEKGQIRAGFQGQFVQGNAQPRGHRCSKCQYEMAAAYIPLDVDRVGYDARLLDAVCAVSWQECYSPAHPVTREEDMQWRRKQLKVAMENSQVTGTEHMAFWAVPDSIYAEAPTTFVRLARYREAFNGSSFAPPDSYASAVLDERIRFPLWQLVFHDAVVITNRWTFTANRYTDENIWNKEDLINLLHGQMPTFMLDRANFEANTAHFVRTAQTVGRWNAEIGFEEMTDFRWLTADGSVQEAVYASGRSAVVNFGGKEHALPDGQRVPAGGFLLRGTKPGK